ncbi:MAG: YitT family protein [Tyzzerella sp.]|nr:YitT family protein [Tyzzerella sp.]
MKIKQFVKELNKKDLAYLLMGSAILAFGLYNVHSISNVTEGGALGLTLLLQHWFGISPALSGFIINFACFFLGWKLLGGKFIVYSFISGGAYSVFYYIFEQFEPVWPEIGNYPLVAAIVGALFVGVGIGLCVRVGGAPSGDDALAMSLSKVFKKEIQWIYLISDLTVLGLSLSYIPVQRILYSLLTVVLSGQIIGWIERLDKKNL